MTPRLRSGQGHDSDFTEAGYRALVRQARERYEFLSFTQAANAEAGVLWRHDIDISAHRSVALARIEHEAGARATYFVYLHSRFYNALEDVVIERLRAVAALGHEFGLHFDPRFIPAAASMEEAVAAERQLLEGAIGMPLTALSFHDPDLPGMVTTDTPSLP